MIFPGNAVFQHSYGYSVDCGPVEVERFVLVGQQLSFFAQVVRIRSEHIEVRCSFSIGKTRVCNRATLVIVIRSMGQEGQHDMRS